MAATEADLTASLNGHSITWHAKNQADAQARSGLSGYYQWMVFEWPTSDLEAVGANNDLTLSVSGGGGNLYDALRMEISEKGANPSITGWHDYEYLSSNGTDTPEDVAVDNNNTGTVVTGGCTPTPITPYIYVNGAWVEESSVTVSSTSAVLDLGPQPLTGTWSWTGPNGYTSTLRQINSIPLTAGTDAYVATYTNSSGCVSQQTFTITVE